MTRCRVASSARLPVAIGLTAALSGCFGIPDVSSTAGPAVSPDVSPERAAAVAEMRVQATAGDTMPYPPVFMIERTTQLAARTEPHPTSEVDAAKAELAAILAARAAASDPNEVATLDARAAELRRLMLETQTEGMRR